MPQRGSTREGPRAGTCVLRGSRSPDWATSFLVVCIASLVHIFLASIWSRLPLCAPVGCTLQLGAQAGSLVASFRLTLDSDGLTNDLLSFFFLRRHC